MINWRTLLVCVLTFSAVARAERIDLSGETSGLAAKFRAAIPIPFRFYDDDEKILRLRGDHELVLAAPDAIPEAELFGFWEFLRGRATDGEYGLRVIGTLRVVDPGGEPIDLDDAKVRAEVSEKRKATMLRDLYGMMKESATHVFRELIWTGNPTDERFTLVIGDEHDIDLKALAGRGYDIPEMIADSLPSAFSYYKPAPGSVASGQRSILDHVMGHADVPAAVGARGSIHLTFAVDASPAHGPEDLAYASYGRLSWKLTAMVDAAAFDVEVDDETLAPEDRVAFRREFTRLAAAGFAGRGRLIPRDHVHVRYAVSAAHGCDDDLRR